MTMKELKRIYEVDSLPFKPSENPKWWFAKSNSFIFFISSENLMKIKEDKKITVFPEEKGNTVTIKIEDDTSLIVL